ncbi:hypothetical protein KIPB_014371, partial [Kipferlia bialata]
TVTLTRSLLRVLCNGIRLSTKGDPQLWDLFKKVPRLVPNSAVSDTLTYGIKTVKTQCKTDVDRYTGYLRFMVSNKLISEAVTGMTSTKARVSVKALYRGDSLMMGAEHTQRLLGDLERLDELPLDLGLSVELDTDLMPVDTLRPILEAFNERVEAEGGDTVAEEREDEVPDNSQPEIETEKESEGEKEADAQDSAEPIFAFEPLEVPNGERAEVVAESTDETERLEAERVEAERLEAETVEAERLAAEKAEAEKLEA